MDAATVDQVRLHFGSGGLLAVNAAIALMMFGVALDLRWADFRRAITQPKAPAIGLAAQFLLLPAATCLLTIALKPHPSIALGMILVAACPGGNLSNIVTWLAKGNTAVSITMTAVSSAAAIVMTPLNLAVWGRVNDATAPILLAVRLDPMSVFTTIALVLGLPLAAGVLVARRFPRLTERLRPVFKKLALVVFVAIVGGALAANGRLFVQVIGLVAFAVAVHNALALALGYVCARLGRLPEADCRAVSIEVGIQNSALGLVLVFGFFEGMGGMAIVVAWWGVWHIVGGLTTAWIFKRFGRRVA